MAIATRKRLITEEELMSLGSDARVEVVDEEIVEMEPVGVLHQIVGRNINRVLDAFVLEHQLGEVFYDSLLFVLASEDEGLRVARVPDMSFTRKGTFPEDFDLERPFPGAPTLAIEIMSPNDKLEEIVQKVGEYLDAGGEQVWIVLPRQKVVYQYRQGDPTVTTYSGDDAMDVEALFPGLEMKREDIFRLPDLG